MGIRQEHPPLSLTAPVQAAVGDIAGDYQLPLRARIIRARQGQEMAPVKSVRQKPFLPAVASNVLDHNLIQYTHNHYRRGALQTSHPSFPNRFLDGKGTMLLQVRPRL